MSAESSPRPSSPPGQAVAAQHLVLRHDPAFVLRFSGERSICDGTTLEAHAHSVAPQSESATAFAPHATRSGWVPTPSPCLSDCPLGPGGPGPCGTFLLAFQWDWDSGTLGLWDSGTVFCLPGVSRLHRLTKRRTGSGPNLVPTVYHILPASLSRRPSGHPPTARTTQSETELSASLTKHVACLRVQTQLRTDCTKSGGSKPQSRCRP